jgi:hypothetical protein
LESEAAVPAAGGGEAGVVDEEAALVGGELFQGDDAAVGGDVVGEVGGGDGDQAAEEAVVGAHAFGEVGRARGVGGGDGGGDVGFAREAGADHAGGGGAVAGAAGGGGGVAVLGVFAGEEELLGGGGAHRGSVAGRRCGGNFTAEACLWRGKDVACGDGDRSRLFAARNHQRPSPRGVAVLNVSAWRSRDGRFHGGSQLS